MNRITRRNFIFKHSLPFFVASVLIFAIPNDPASSAKLIVLVIVVLTLAWYLYGINLRFHDLGKPLFTVQINTNILLVKVWVMTHGDKV